MNTKTRILLFIIGLFCCSISISCSDDDNADSLEDELEDLAMTAESFDDYTEATAVGYTDDVSGFVPQMGHHILNPSLMDETFDMLNPEFVLYAPDIDSVMRFVAVEYGIQVGTTYPTTTPPAGFTGTEDAWILNGDSTLWTLHVWIGLDNPDGIFDPTNPFIF